MAKRIMRVYLNISPRAVKARAQSKSARGTPYTVGAAGVKPGGSDRESLKKAVREVLWALLPPSRAEPQ